MSARMTEAPRAEAPAFLAGGGEAGALMRARDWSGTPLGPPEGWPGPLRTVVGIMLAANQPMFAAWGPERTMLYNDGYAEILGPRHPASIGRPFREVWPELDDAVFPLVALAYDGQPTAMDDIALVLTRKGYEEEAHFSFFYAPLRDEAGAVGGMYCACVETTAKVFAERQAAFRHLLDERLRTLSDPEEVMAEATAALGLHLGAARVGYAEVDAAGWATVARDWNAGGLPGLVGRHRLEDYGPARLAGFRAGRGEVVDDVTSVPLDAAAVAAHLSFGVRAQVVVPLVKDGRLAALLFAHHAAPRRWRPEEIAAVQDTAERTWAAAEQARAERAERQAELRFRAMADTAPVLIWEVDESGVVFVNRQYLDFFGVGFEALKGRGWMRFLHPDDAAAFAEAHRAAVGEGRAYSHACRFLRADGQWRWLRNSGAPAGEGRFVGGSLDVTDLQEAQLALRELNARLEEQVAARTAERDSVWRNARDIMVVLDPGGRFLAANPAWTATLGWTAEEAVGQPVFDFLHPDDLEPTRGALATATAGPLPPFGNRLRHRDGGWRDISWVAAPEGGRIYASGRDVTEEKARRAELAAAHEALRQAQKMEAVGQLTGGIAHDFNNMLQGIAGGLDLARRRIAAGRAEEASRYLDAAKESAARAATLTRRLLAFARRQPLDARPVEMDALLRGIADLVQRTVGPQVQVELRAGDGAWTVLCDANQMESALLNLAINARDAMPGGGRLAIATREVRLRAADLAGYEDMRPGAFVEVAVSDTGEGMSEEVAARAFEPFFTTKPTGQGTGLGLSQVYGFVRQSGGLVRLESRPGEGTTVRLLLPRHEGAAQAAAAPAEPRAPTQVAGTVLLVEDEPVVRTTAAEALREAGLTVVAAADGAAALSLLRAGAAPDILVSDVGLPGMMNGRQVAEAARELRPRLPVLFVTGYAGSVLGDVMPEGMAVIGKPFTLETLVGQVRRMVEAGRQGGS